VRSAGRKDGRYQVNVPLNEEHWHLVLTQLAIREEVSVPDLLRPVIIEFLERTLAADADLSAAVDSITRARAKSRP
jgi:hypothetical protein